MGVNGDSLLIFSMSAARSGSDVTFSDGSGGMLGGAGGTVVVVVAGGEGLVVGVLVYVGGGCLVPAVSAGCFFTHAADPASSETINTKAIRFIGVLIICRARATSSDTCCCLRS